MVLALVASICAAVFATVAPAEPDVTSTYGQSAPLPQQAIGTSARAGSNVYIAGRDDLRLLRVRRAQGLTALTLAIREHRLPSQVSCHRTAKRRASCSFVLVLAGGSTWVGRADVRVFLSGRVTVDYEMEA
jgi:hypothetical protein